MRPNLHADDWNEPDPGPDEAARGFGARWGRLVRGDQADAVDYFDGEDRSMR